MILSLDGVLLMGSCNLRFEERGAGKSSSVSVSGGGEDEGGRDEAMEGVDVGWDGTAALRQDGNSSSALSVVYLAGGKIFCAGRNDMTVV